MGLRGPWAVAQAPLTLLLPLSADIFFRGASPLYGCWASHKGTLPPRATMGHQCPAPRKQCCHTGLANLVREKENWGPSSCLSHSRIEP